MKYLVRSFEPELADHGLHRSHMAVRQTANNLEAGFCCAFTRDLAAIKQRRNARNQRLRQLRQIRQRALLDAPTLAIALAQQNRWRRFPVRNGVDEHGRPGSHACRRMPILVELIRPSDDRHAVQ